MMFDGAAAKIGPSMPLLIDCYQAWALPTTQIDNRVELDGWRWTSIISSRKATLTALAAFFCLLIISGVGENQHLLVGKYSFQ